MIDSVNLTLQSFWPEWHIDREIGEGSHGIVYRASTTDGEVSAIKVISVPHNQAEISAFMAEGNNELTTRSYFLDIVNDFVNEISFLDNLKNEEHIVHIEDHKVVAHEQEIGWDIYIRMELLTPCLAFFPKENINQNEVIRLGCDICKALIACSKLQIIHRDIKPENIFVSNDGTFKLGDFGVARQLDHKTNSLSQKGTYNYMAPEVFKGEGYTENVDLYSLGIVLYRLMNNNRAPFLSPTKQLISYKETIKAFERRMDGEEIPDPLHGTPAFTALIQKACRFVPEQRYQSAEEMLRAFRKVSESITAGERAERAFSRKTARSISVRRKVKFIASIAAICAVIVISLTAGLYLLFRFESPLKAKQNTPIENDSDVVTVPNNEIPSFEESGLTNHEMNWQDDALEAAMRDLTGIRKKPIMLKDVWDLISANGGELNLNGQEISNVSALGELTCITMLYLGHNNLTDLSGLESLENMTVLDIQSNSNLSSLLPLSQLHNLEWLDAAGCSIENLSRLHDLKSLKQTDLSKNKIKDISPLGSLDLEYLDISYNVGITDITSLSSMTEMTSLYMSNCNISGNLDSIRNLTKLEILEIQNNPLSDISAIADFGTLRTLKYSIEEVSNEESRAALEKVSQTADEIDPPLQD